MSDTEKAALELQIDELCAAVERLRKTAAMLASARTDLLAENAKLREDLEFERSENGWVREFLNRMGQKCGTKDCPSLVAYVTKLEAENAKLRELVANYSAAAKYLCGHSHCNECNLDCASVFGDVPSGWDCARMLLDKRARELGVKVNYK